MTSNELTEAFQGTGADVSLARPNQLVAIQRPIIIDGTPTYPYREECLLIEGEPFHPEMLKQVDKSPSNAKKGGSNRTTSLTPPATQLRDYLTANYGKKQAYKICRNWTLLCQEVKAIPPAWFEGKRFGVHYELLDISWQIFGDYQKAKDLILWYPSILGSVRDENSLAEQMHYHEKKLIEQHKIKVCGSLEDAFTRGGDNIFITEEQSIHTMTELEKSKMPSTGVITGNLHCGWGKTSGFIKPLVDKYETVLVICHRVNALKNAGSELGIPVYKDIREELARDGDLDFSAYRKELRKHKKLAITDKSLHWLVDDGEFANQYKRGLVYILIRSCKGFRNRPNVLLHSFVCAYPLT